MIRSRRSCTVLVGIDHLVNTPRTNFIDEIQFLIDKARANGELTVTICNSDMSRVYVEDMFGPVFSDIAEIRKAFAKPPPVAKGRNRKERRADLSRKRKKP